MRRVRPSPRRVPICRLRRPLARGILRKLWR
uniref:Uncharacterized protein n=1 Tax=Acidiphilium symbioticum TaxID=94005 RepID=Q9REI5_9PROT|nr:hypothetical protein [Acidiphilium symbioticum]